MAGIVGGVFFTLLMLKAPKPGTAFLLCLITGILFFITGDMSGSITTGSGTVTVSSGTIDPATGKYKMYINPYVKTHETGTGAALGSGAYGPISGTVTIGPGKVILNTNRGAGIGTGVLTSAINSPRTNMSGTVNICKGADLSTHSLLGNQIGIGTFPVSNGNERHGDGSILPDARLNVQLGAILQGQTTQSLQDVYDLKLEFPDAQIFELIVPAAQVPGAQAPSAQSPSALAFPSDYRVVSGGVPVPMEAKQEGTVLTITADYENAELHITAQGLQNLKSQGIETVVFKKLSAESSFTLASVLGSNLVLTHEGTSAELTLDGKISGLLK